MDKDELKTCEAYGDDYTIKIYEREDCRYYAVVVYETDTDSKLVYTCKSQPDAGKARALAVEAIDKHRKAIRKFVGMSVIMTLIFMFMMMSGCIGVVDSSGVAHYVGVGVETRPAVYMRVGYWFYVPLEHTPPPPPRLHHRWRH